MSLSDIHPVIIARNAAPTIEKTLESLGDFPEVVVYDNGSSDETDSVCARFANVRFVKGEFLGFGPTKNHAASLASGPWVLSLDADESLSSQLKASLDAADLTNPGAVYLVNRHNLFMGRDVQRGGWGQDWLVRLYHRDNHAFSNVPVHEKIVVSAASRSFRLEGPLWHRAVTDVDQFLQKISRYTELRRGQPGRIYSPAVILIRACWAFFRSYILKAGLLEGWRGLVIAYAEGNGSFYRHIKRYADQRVREEAQSTRHE
jgi:glycosyltransferase involved in cell wall biosynthesis